MSLVVNLKATDTGLVDRSENTTRFYEDIRRYPKLSREDEVKWFEILHHGTKEEQKKAYDHLIKCNQRLVVSVAKKWANTDTLMDYVNEANFGLIEAIGAFDPSKGNKFCSFAIWYLKRAINHYNTEGAPMIRKTNSSKTSHVISKATNDFFQKYERAPSTDELLDIVNDKYKKNIKSKGDLLNLQMARIDVNDHDEEEYAYGDVADFNNASASANGYEQQVVDNYNKKLVNALLSELSPREQLLLKMKFGMYEDRGLQRELEIIEIADKLGLTPERVRQLEAKAIKKLKKIVAKKLKEL